MAMAIVSFRIITVEGLKKEGEFSARGVHNDELVRRIRGICVTTTSQVDA